MDPLPFTYHWTLILNSHFWLISLVLLCALPHHEARMMRGNTTDRQALIAFKACISDNLLGPLSSWNETNSTLHFCNWLGVTCSATRHPERVTALGLGSLNLTGTLSPYLANLTLLRSLNLSSNNFHGPIPSDFGKLSRLQYLNLSYNFLEGNIPPLTHCSKLRRISLTSNKLTGQIPTNFTHCLNLSSISLGNNQLTGTIPTSLGSLPKLSKLGIYTNQLTGGIPPSLGNATSLTVLGLSENNFIGHIPHELGRVTNLEILALYANSLSGEIPSSLFNMSAVSYFNVGSNKLSGVLPHDMGSTLPGLQIFEAYYNQLGGPIPVTLTNISALQAVALYENMFVGPIPNNLGSLQYLTMFEVAWNQLEAEDGEFLNSLSNCSNLNDLNLSGNNLQGLRLSSITNLSTQLASLVMTDNQISGTIPRGIDKLDKLNLIDMSHNFLSGTIPSTIGKLQNLQFLSFSANHLYGKIPTSIGNLTQLNELYLAKNEFQESIPSSIENLLSLGVLDLSYNKLNGTIPAQALSKLSSLSKYLNLSHNLLTGSLPSQIGSLINLNELDVSENRLSGEIPGSLGGCQLLGQLLMQGNFFQGIIPSALSGLNGIQGLDLSRNNLSGPIPKFLESFRLLNYLNLSFNDLEGRVPQGGVFGNASAISVLGNKKLCGGIKELCLHPCDSIDEMSSHRSSMLKVIIPAIVAFILVIVILSAAYYIQKQRTKADPLKPSLNEPFVQISYAEIHKATDGFSSSNLIGVGSFGSVYKGIMRSDPNQVVAIKVLNLDQRGADKSFMAECDSLRVIRHRNLINIITVCSSIDRNGDDFKALIFEYMPNGSLDEWLHPKVDENNENLKSLSLAQRWSIVMDVALALDYLHHQCETPIVHCDLKPSNILLDDEMSAHVGDFGLARFLRRTMGSSQDTYSSGGIKGSIGYIAPEYGMGGPITTQGDVYSYGVLLLETFTGKRPTDKIFESGLNLHKYVETAYPHRVLDVIDPSIALNEEGIGDIKNSASDLRERMHESMISIFKIGLLCSKTSTDERLEMGDVIKELLLVKKILDGRSHAEPTYSTSDHDHHRCDDISECGKM